MFTGGTLLVGSVGHPDPEESEGSLGHTTEDMAKLMFNTLQTKILTLPDDVQVTTELLLDVYVCVYSSSMLACYAYYVQCQDQAFGYFPMGFRHAKDQHRLSNDMSLQMGSSL